MANLRKRREARRNPRTRGRLTTAPRSLGYEPLEDRRLLAVVTVDTNLDVVDFTDGVTSLREAIFATNLVGGHDEIRFDFGHDGPETILLTQGELQITDALTITGPGAELLTIDASGNDPTPDENNGDGSRVFYITADTRIEEVTITGGDSNTDGGGIRSVASLDLIETKVAGNSAYYSFYVGIQHFTASGGGIFVETGSLSIRDSELSHNYANGLGGGLALERGALDVRDSFVGYNQAGGLWINEADGVTTIQDTLIHANSGRGISSRNHNELLIINSNVSENTGGGLSVSGSIQHASKTTVLKSSIIDNSTKDGGGGVRSRFNELHIIDSKIENNSAGNSSIFQSGGGLDVWDFRDLGVPNLVVLRSSISNNHSSNLGGGILTDCHYVDIRESTISENATSGFGGGLLVANARPGVKFLLSHSTVVDNRADGDGPFNTLWSNLDAGGGINPILALSNQVILDHTIVARNLGRDGQSNDLNAPNFTLRNSLLGNSAGTGLTEAPVGSPDANGNLIGGPVHGIINPLLGPLADNGGPTKTHALLPGSPAINAGDLNAVAGLGGVPEFDQRGPGFDRVYSGRIDIGAFEVHELSDLNLLVDTLVDESDGDYSRGDLSLREAIELANANPAPDTIRFDPILTAVAGPLPATIRLTMGELRITDSVDIQGPGAELLTIDASGNDPTPDEDNGDGSRVFNIDDGDGLVYQAVNISGLTLTGGDVQSHGGAIFSRESLLVSHSTITGNAALEDGGGLWGYGLLTTTPVIIAHSKIVNNRAGDDGGGIWVFSWAESTGISECTIAANKATRLAGGVLFSGVSSIKNCEIFNNQAGDDGGGIVGGGTNYVSGSEIHDNISKGSGGGLKTNGLAVISDSVFERNQAGADGGGLYATTIEMTNSQLLDNSSIRDGGGLFTVYASIENSTIQGNTASNGGGVNSRVATITGSSVSYNTAGTGGGIRAVQSSTVVDCSIIGNKALEEDGGGIVSLNLNLQHSVITDNYASKDGGGVVMASISFVTDCVIEDNHAGFEGGGIYVVVGYDTPFPIYPSVISTAIVNNTAGHDGGGVYVGIVRKALVFFINNTISGNEANRGGGIFVNLDFDNRSTMRLHYSTVTDNSSGTLEDAPGSGGGIFLATGKLEVVHSIIAENEDPTGVGTDLTGYLGSVLDVRHSLIGTNLGTGLTPAPVGSPDANGNLIGGSTASKRINPLLGPLADNGGPTKTHALLPGSPAIDAGDPSLVQGMRGVPEFDQRGRPYGRVAGRIDIGAFEVQPPGGMLRGDFDGDADTDGFDFLAWQRGFGRIGGALRPDGDGTDDGDVDNNDEAVWEATFGTHPLPLPPVVQRYRIASSPTSVAREQLIDAAIAVATLPDRLQTVRSAAPLNIAELSAELARHVEVSNERWIRVDARRNSEDPWGRRAERTPPVDAADGGFEQLAPEMLDEGFSQF